MELMRPVAGAVTGRRACPKHQEHVWKKGEDLNKLAREHGLKNADVIWDDPANKALVKKRGKMDALAAGDKIMVPEGSAKAKAKEQLLLTLERTLGHTARKVNLYNKLMLENATAKKQVIEQLQQNYKNLADISSKWDTAEFVIGLGKAMTRIGLGAAKGLHGTLEELKKADEEVRDGAKEFRNECQKHELHEFEDWLYEHADGFIGLIAFILKGINNLISPKWWTYAYARYTEGQGVPWASDVFDDVGEDLQRQIETLEKEFDDRQEQFKTAHSAAYDAQMKQYKKLQDAKRAG